MATKNSFTQRRKDKTRKGAKIKEGAKLFFAPFAPFAPLRENSLTIKRNLQEPNQ
jgi:hypothetical protein